MLSLNSPNPRRVAVPIFPNWRRTGGEVAHMDLIFILLVAEAAAQSFGDYKSVTEGLIVILTMMGLTHGLNMLSFRVPFFERLTTQPPLEVVRDGKQLSRSMDKELLTEDELMSFLRQSGLDDLRKVKLAVIEGNGKISIIPVSK